MTTTITRPVDPGIQPSDAVSAMRNLEALRRCGYHVTILSPKSTRTDLYEVSAVGEEAGVVHLITARAGHLHEAIESAAGQMDGIRSALDAIDSLIPDMVARARTLPTETLRAMYQEGTELGARSTLWEDTMRALAIVLKERASTEAIPSEVTA